jgi:UDP:flavonoid glycosyltransferase YjiC (YdhE family)
MPQELTAFLNDGRPPIYFGFGSVPGLDPDAATQEICDALHQTGNRGILAVGGGALRKGREFANIHVINDAPHDRLFRMSRRLCIMAAQAQRVRR